MATYFAQKDPDALLDYGWDWSDWLVSGDAISVSTWVIDAGLTNEASEQTVNTTKVWLSGGSLGVEYTVTNRVTTLMGRTDDRSATILCEAK